MIEVQLHAGPELRKHCEGLESLATGEAVLTPAFGLTAYEHLIHAVAPMYIMHDEDEWRRLLTECASI